MGECVHDAGKQMQPFRNYGCIKCGSGFIYGAEGYSDFFSEAGFFKLWKWAQEQKWWGEFNGPGQSVLN